MKAAVGYEGQDFTMVLGAGTPTVREFNRKVDSEYIELLVPLVGGENAVAGIQELQFTAAMRWDMRRYGAYAAVKEAIRSLTRAAACEWAGEGIRTNVILPHAASPALAGWIEANPEEAAAFMATIPQGRVGDCEADIGRFVAVLCSDASAYVNGQTIAIDGGQARVA